ncbi:hypothetical protein SLA2020_350510 [Shorea laevis]
MKNQIPWSTIGLVAAWYGSNIGVLLLNKWCPCRASSPPHSSSRSPASASFSASPSSAGTCRWGTFRCRLNQAIGATTPFFTAVFAYVVSSKKEAWLTYLALVPVVAGVIIASGGEPSFHLFGFIMCVSATAARALKSVLQDILLCSDGEKLNSMNLLLYMAPIAVVFLLPATMLMEENVVEITVALARKDIKIVWYLLFNSSLAYFVNLTNFLVTKHTSALTLQVLGNAKGAVAVVVSILIFKNPISVIGMAGYGLTVVGVVMYSEAKKK